MSALHAGTPGTAAAPQLPHHAGGTHAFGWWGMVGLIGTEAMLFGSLVASYFYLRFTSGPQWPPGDIAKPELGLVAIMTVVLWSSSIPVHIAEVGIKKGKQGRLRWGLAIGFVLGAAFLGMQVVLEYPQTLEEFSPTTNAYGSLFYGLTGLHGSHVAVGLLFNAWTQVRAWRGAFDEDRHVTVQNFAMYWHFVDAVWAVVLVTIYLSPHL